MIEYVVFAFVVLLKGFVVIVTTLLLAGTLLFEAGPVVRNWDGIVVLFCIVDDVMLLHLIVVVLDMLVLDEEMVLLLGDTVEGVGKGNNIFQKNGLDVVVVITSDCSSVE